MIAKKIIGSLHDEQYKHLKPDYITVEWYEVFKKIHKKITRSGLEIGIFLDNEILTKGLNQDDILYMLNDNSCIAVDIPPCEVIKISAHDNHEHMLIKAAYEIGNRHAPAFWGNSYKEIITPYQPTLLDMLGKLRGIIVTTETKKLNLDKRLSASFNNHTH